MRGPTKKSTGVRNRGIEHEEVGSEVGASRVFLFLILVSCPYYVKKYVLLRIVLMFEFNDLILTFMGKITSVIFSFLIG